MEIKYRYLGQTPLSDAITLMEDHISAAKQNEKIYFWGLEHPLVYTSGLQSKAEHIRENNLETQTVRRGGSVTLHNPGQLVFYTVCPIHSIKGGLQGFVRLLEICIIHCLGLYKIASAIHPPNSGVYTKNGKIAFIGLGGKKGFIYHGAAININNDLDDYSKIFSCGLTLPVTRVKNEMTKEVSPKEFSQKLFETLAKHLIEIPPSLFRKRWHAFYETHALHKGLLEGIYFFNSRQYWEAHELWEIYWQKENDPKNKNLLHFLIQLASAIFKLTEKPNKKGAISLLKKSLKKLDSNFAYEVGHFYISNFTQLIDYAKRILFTLENFSNDDEGPIPFEAFLIISVYDKKIIDKINPLW